MRFSRRVTGGSGQRARSGRKTGGLLCLLSLAALSASLEAQTPAGTQIAGSAQATYQDLNGGSYTVTSNTVTVTVGQAAGVDIEPPRTGLFNPGSTAVFQHTLANIGNDVDSLTVSAASFAGWPARVYRDVNSDGLLDAGDSQLSQAVTLTAGQAIDILVAVDIPASAAVRGAVDTVAVTAASLFDPTMADALQNELQVRDAGITVALTKSVDQSSVTTGANLTYTVDFSATGTNGATAFTLVDTVPAGVTYVPGTLRWNGVAQSDNPADDAGWYDAANRRIVFQLSDITSGETGTGEFRVSVTAGATGIITNRAAAFYQTVVGPDSVASNEVSTNVVPPELHVAKLLTGANTARIGETIQYTIEYGNGSATAVAQGVVLTDTLPLGLEFVAAQPSPQVAGQILSWDLGDLQPGDTSLVTLTTRVSQSVIDTLRVRNVAVLGASNASSEIAAAEEAVLIGLDEAQLSLEKTAGLLEVGIGEVVPYTLTVENTGQLPVADVTIHDLLPEGGRYSINSLVGADSAQADGRNLTIYVTATLAAGASRTVRYSVAIVSAATEIVENRAYAAAQEQLVTSDEAVAWVRVRSNWPMETRAAIGKVWLDRDGDGTQDPGEPGVAGVEIWSGSGAVATSDGDGKFSFVNLRAGHHSFRLDRATLPAGYSVSGTAGQQDLAIRAGDGWTTPRISFPVVPTEGKIETVYLPFTWQFVARPIQPQREVEPGPTQPLATAVRERTTVEIPTVDSVEVARPLVLRGVSFQSASADLTPLSFAILDQVVESLLAYPEIRVEIAGHTDSAGSLAFNMVLAPARAHAVREYLIQRGVDPSRLVAKGYGPFRPIASNETPEGRALNRRVELHVLNESKTEQTERFHSRLSSMLDNRDSVVEPIDPTPVVETLDPRSTVEYELVVSNPYDVELDNVAVLFEPAIDSAIALASDSTIAAVVGGRITLPPVAPRSTIEVKGWAVTEQDSAMATLEGSDRPAELLSAEIHNPLRPASAISRPRAITDSLPRPSAVPDGAEVEIVIVPSATGWPTLTLSLPSGWRVIPGTTRLDNAPATDPTISTVTGGGLLAQWIFPDQPMTPVVVKLGTAGAVDLSEAVVVSTLRTADERQQDRSRSFIAGPGVEMFSPSDGAVLSSDRVFVGVRGEPGAPVALFDGDSLIDQADMRIDGVHDFIGVSLDRGPHRLRVRMLNSWKQERWDSMTVHVSGAAARFELPSGPITLTADRHARRTVRVRLIDEWGVPVIRPTNVTVTAEAVELNSQDSDPSSVGLQLKSDQAGWLNIELTPGVEVGKGKLMLQTGHLEGQIDIDVLPAIRPFMLTGVGRVGIGASPDALGTITALGSLDSRTSVVLSYDSRRLDAGRDALGQVYSPLEEAQYPILGDAGQYRAINPSRNVFAARLERGFDWVAVGDVATNDFATGLKLTTYRRALTGGAARITTGHVVWQGFGSLTRQSLQQDQVRGVGSSGPYALRPGIVPGSERITVETRAAENAERVVNRQAMIRFIDYQIDYERGSLQFKRLIPAADPYGNSIFIVVTYEVEQGDDQRLVAGLRASLDAAGWLRHSFLDSLRIGITGIRSDEPLGAHHLAGADLRLLRFGGFDVGAEVSYSDTPDSSGFATAIGGTWHGFDEAVALNASWSKIGDGFGNPANIALQGGTEELKLGGDLKIGSSTLNLTHERQYFQNQAIKRTRTAAGVTQALGNALQIEARGGADRFDNATSANESRAAELRLTWSPLNTLKLWTEGRHQFAHTGDVFLPSHVGAGAEYQILPGISLEARHLRIDPLADEPYSVTRLGLRSAIGFGTQVWGSYALAGGAGGSRNAAIVGLNNELRLGSAWTFNTMFERRVGLDNASIGDPVRALPYLQAEEDYWSVGLGVELLPTAAPYRLSARGEYRDGELQSTQLMTVAGDVSINRSLAILSRQEFLRIEQLQPNDVTLRRRLHSLWGAAFRPINTDALNVLAKFSWMEEANPRLGTLTQTGEEQRIIGAAEVIWAPAANTELAGRYAVRRSVAEQPVEDGTGRLESWADYAGLRLQQGLNQWLAIRGEGRLLVEHTSDTRRWDATPALLFTPIRELELAAGYRFGNLMDPDFTVHGGFGWFVTVSARVTESVFPTAADFWRDRFGR
jgi:uncharacterized repeat protein (TIGR01451 family)